MDPDQARRLDRLLTPMCSAVGTLRRLVGGRPARLLIEGDSLPEVAGHSTVVVKLAGLGSLSFLAPILRAYAEALAPADQYLVTQQENRGLLDLLDWRVKPLYLETGRARESLGGGLGLLRQVRALRPAAVVDIEYYSRACTLLSLASGSPMRLGFAEAPWRRNLLTHAVPWNPRWHLAKVTAWVLGKLAGADVEAPAVLPLAPGVLGECPVERLPDRRLVCVNVNTSVLGVEGRLPLPHFRRMLSRLAAETAVQLVFIGSRGEAPFVKQVVEFIGEVAPLVNVSGQTSLRELLSLLWHADLLITNDTGPLHFAVGLSTPTLSFFGPANPANFGPREGPHTIACSDAVCSPCISERNMKKPPCRGRNVCLAALDPEDLGRLAAEALLTPPDAPRVVRPRLLPADEMEKVFARDSGAEVRQ